MGFEEPGMPTAGNDTITGTSGNDVIDGLAGDDVINGMDGNDFLYGGLGNDSVSGGDGNDYLAGIGGRDTLAGGNGDDTLVLGEGVYAEAFGGAGRDTFQMGFASSFSTARISVIYDLNFNEDVFFAQSGYTITTGLSIDGIGIGNDIRVTAIGHRIDILNPIMPTVRLGTNLADSLFGTLLSDTLNGLGGNDTLNGGGGNDSLLGGDGDDWIIDQDGFSTDGDDTVRGGRGKRQNFRWRRE
jgi:Ca2+-binding RTX toxin-like protein